MYVSFAARLISFAVAHGHGHETWYCRTALISFSRWRHRHTCSTHGHETWHCRTALISFSCWRHRHTLFHARPRNMALSYSLYPFSVGAAGTLCSTHGHETWHCRTALYPSSPVPQAYFVPRTHKHGIIVQRLYPFLKRRRRYTCSRMATKHGIVVQRLYPFSRWRYRQFLFHARPRNMVLSYSAYTFFSLCRDAARAPGVFGRRGGRHHRVRCARARGGGRHTNGGGKDNPRGISWIAHRVSLLLGYTMKDLDDYVIKRPRTARS